MSNQILVERPETDDVAFEMPKIEKARRSDGQVLLGLLAIALLSHGALLYLHITHLLSRSYYEFIYVLPIAIWLMYRRYGGVANQRIVHPNAMKAAAAVTAALVLFGLSILMWSPWLASVSLIATFIALVYAAWGVERLSVLMPAILLGCLIIPPPLRYDTALTTSLRSVATVCSSRVLDSVGVLHLAEGNVITVASGSLFVADACSGVNSLYSLLAVALFYCLWTRRHYFHTILMLAMVLPVVLLENTLRIALIPLSLEWFETDLSTGWPHTLLGITLFALSALLIASFDQLLCFISPAGAAVGSLFSALRRNRRSALSANSMRSGLGVLPTGRLARAGLVLTAAIILVVGGVVQSLLYARSVATRPHVAEIDFSQVKREFLPTQWNGWKQVNFEPLTRANDDPFGEHSFAWTYQRGEQTATFSLDYTFPNIHDLSKCYTAIGWSLVDHHVGKDPAEMPYMGIEMKRQNYGEALLFFSLHSLQGHTEANAFGDSVVDNFNKRFGYQFEEAGPWYQVQLFATKNAHASSQQDAEAAEMFAAFRATLLKQIGHKPATP